jgi:hypothetical protein
MPRGGRRTGVPGRQYTNRSDLRLAPTAATGQAYGVRAEQIAAQRAVPMGPPPTDVVPSAAPQTPMQQAALPATPPVLPGSLTPLDAPTERPDEHVMSGAPVGPGPGPAMPLPAQYATARDFLVGALGTSGNPEVQYLLNQMQQRGL